MENIIASTYSQEDLSVAALLLSLRGVRSDTSSSAASASSIGSGSSGSTSSFGSRGTGSASSAGSGSTRSASSAGSGSTRSTSSAGSGSTRSASSIGSGSTRSASSAGSGSTRSTSSAGSRSTGSASSARSSETGSQSGHVKRKNPAIIRPVFLEAGPSRVVDEDAGDFSPSDSSWAPSEDERASEEEISNRRGTRTRKLKRRRHWSSSSVETKKKKIEINNNYNNGAALAYPRPRSLISPEPPLAFGPPASPASSDSVQSPDQHEDEETCVRMQDKQEETIGIGSGRTRISKLKYKKINWENNYTKATRDLLVAAFSRGILATHSLTGKKSPAFLDKPAKQCLDPIKVADVVEEVIKFYNVNESLVRTIITTKCADESKMLRMRLKRAADRENNT